MIESSVLTVGDGGEGLCVAKYRDKRLARFADGQFVKAFSAFERTLERRLRSLNDATTLRDIGSVKGHHLEALSGNRAGQYSIRINDQYRVCFEWPDDRTGAIEIEVVDYH
jgi:proteic killer suppression protein